MRERMRRCGVLLHPTSLPGPHGIGDLGKEAFLFVDFLERAGQTLWQILPLGPTGYGDSPYACFSTFAGNPLLISLDTLAESQDLRAEDLRDIPRFNPEKADFQLVQQWKLPLLNKAAGTFLSTNDKEKKKSYRAFLRKHESWLDDFALFMALKEEFQKKAASEGRDGATWANYWDRDIRLKEPKAVKKWKTKLSDKIEVQKVFQYWFFSQWLAVRKYANSRGIQIIGDIPIFVAEDSVDVWANRKFFKLDKAGRQTCVAGVPPDYFSATGQLWGNPIYNWKALKDDGFSWWLDRIKAIRELVDIIRIDHFRGFEAYWEIPAGMPDATTGKWVKAPGFELFKAVRKKYGPIPILAEDLGLITPEVEYIRDYFDFPGMKILQFAFDSGESGASGENGFLPQNYRKNCVVYTGSHDNDTIRGWYESAKRADRRLARDYIGHHFGKISWSFIRSAIASTADTAIIPAQDLLNLKSFARMNTPSTLSDRNWSWRMKKNHLNERIALKLRHLTKMYGR